MLIFFIFCFLKFIYCGTINQANADPIQNSVANQAEIADYTFYFSTENNLAVGGQLQIIFPYQYQNQLGITTPLCSLPCTISGYVVTLTYSTPLFKNVAQSVTIYNVVNPSQSGGTGKFILKTLLGNAIIDQNFIFGSIGIASAIVQFTSTLVELNSGGISEAGAYTTYKFVFKAPNEIPSDVFMKIVIPKQFLVPKFPTCVSFSIQGVLISGLLVCENIGQNVIQITGINAAIPIETESGILISMTNPSYEVLTDVFKIQILRALTTIIYFQDSNIPGVQIDPGQFKYVTLNKLNPNILQTKNKIMDYKLVFKQTNDLTTSSYIKVQFPSTFIIIPYIQSTQIYGMDPYILYGLDDVSESSKVSISLYVTAPNNYLLIHNFKPISQPTEIAMIIRLRNPQISYTTTPIQITSYTSSDLVTVIDKDNVKGYTTIENYPATLIYNSLPGLFPLPLVPSSSPNTIAPVSSYTIFTSDIADQGTLSLEFSIQPSINIPASGFIRVRIPDEFYLLNQYQTITPSNCLIYINNGFATTFQNAQSCVASDQEITLQITSNMVFRYDVTTVYYFRLLNIIQKPQNNGTYLFDISTIDIDGNTLLESYSDFLLLTSNSIQTANIKMYGQNLNHYGLLHISFTTIKFIPSGAQQNKATDKQGIIIVQFNPQNLWDSSLGTLLSDQSLFECKAVSGLVPGKIIFKYALKFIYTYNLFYLYILIFLQVILFLVQGEELICILTIGTFTNGPRITVKNFQEIQSQTPVSFQIPRIKNPTSSTGASVTVVISQIYNRIQTDLNIITPTSTSSAMILPQTVTGGTSSSNYYQYSSNILGTTFDLTFSPMFSSNVNKNGYILVELPYYDRGFIQKDQIISCYISTDGSNFDYYPCQKYPMVDWIMIKINTSLTILSGQNSKIKIINLKWPRYMINFSTTNCFKASIIDDINLQRSFSAGSCTAAPDPVPIPFTISSINAPQKMLGQIDAKYGFKFQVNNEIPQNSVIMIYFPQTYSILGSSPVPTFETSNLQDISSTQSVQIILNDQFITISNFASVPSNTIFEVNGYGIKNPSSSIISSGWKIEIYFNNMLMCQQENFDYFYFSSQFQSQFINFESIDVFPLNAAMTSDYTIIFTPKTQIPAGSQIQVTFPVGSYKNFDAPDCSISGGLSTFQSCTLSISTFFITTNSIYKPESGSIYLLLKNINNPDLITTDGFIIKTIYDNVVLDSTNELTLTSRTVTTINQPNSITVNYIRNSPMNEGESASYQFNFLPSLSFDYSKQILLIFPKDYDELIGQFVTCSCSSGLRLGITCSIRSRIVYITIQETYIPSSTNSITISLNGVINPNFVQGTTTAQFKIAILEGKNNFIMAEQQAGTVTVLAAPGWTNIISLSSDSYYARVNGNYNLLFKITTFIPMTKNEGRILIDFPKQFTIPDQHSTCTTTTTLFAQSLTCYIISNRVYIYGHLNNYIGNIQITIVQIQNPVLQCNTDRIFVQTFDGLNQKIIQKSFSNLDPFSFTYIYPGALIYINYGNDITIQRGTQSQEIKVTLDFPCKLNLIIKPILNSYHSLPFEISLIQGTMLQTFKITIPMSHPDGIFIIKWKISNDLIPNLYTPIQDTNLIITASNRILITIPTILSIPLGGNSLPLLFTSSNMPDIGVNIIIDFASSYKGMSKSHRIVNYNARTSRANLTIFSSSDPNAVGSVFSLGTVQFYLQGVNIDQFYLSSSSATFKLISADIIPPIVSSLSVDTITQTSCTMHISVSEPVQLFYMWALSNTRFPSLNQLKNFEIPLHASTRSFYDTIVITDTNIVSININGLSAQTSYQIYVYIVDRGGNVNTDQRSIIFTTLDRYPSWDFTLKFFKNSLSNDEKKNIINGLEFMLSLPAGKIQEKKYYLGSVSDSIQRRMLQYENSYQNNSKQIAQRQLQVDTSQILKIYTFINLQMISIPESPYYPSPQLMVASLKNFTTQLLARFPYFDDSFVILNQAFQSYKLKFVVFPSLFSTYPNNVTFKFQLFNYGSVYAVCIQKSLIDSGMIPSPQQINWGYNGYNEKVISGNVEISKIYFDFYLSMKGLQSNTLYTAYFIAGTAHPGYPDLMDDVYSVDFTTIQAYTIERLDIQSINLSNRVIFYFIILFVFILIFLM